MLKLSIKGFTVHMNYLHKAKNRQTYNYRRIVPADLKQHYSAREIIKSLKTGDETIALTIGDGLREGLAKGYPRSWLAHLSQQIRFTCLALTPVDIHNNRAEESLDVHSQYQASSHRVLPY